MTRRINALLERRDPDAAERIDEPLAFLALRKVDLEDPLDRDRNLRLRNRRADDRGERDVLAAR
jgi:hypothetical protein